MNIFSYFKKNNIDTIDRTFYSKIREWKSWYNSDVPKFSSYKVYTGNGTSVNRKRKSLGMAKKLSEDIADLLLNERVAITISDPRTSEFVNQVLANNQFIEQGNEYQERKAYTGTSAYVLYLDDMEVTEDGATYGGTVRINYVSGENIYPISWNNGLVHECIFAFPHVFQRKRYIHLQKHMLENGAYVIENAILENQSGSQEGKELTHEEWSQLRPFKDLVERVETGSSEPQFVIDRLNLANNADEDETNPMGIAIFANALDILKKIDLEFDSYSNEFELGRKRIFVAPELMKNENGSPTFDAESGIFYLLPEDYDTRQEGLIKEVNMEIRSEDHRKAINDDLNLLSMKCGFGTEHYKFDGSGVKTATEVISENSDMYRMIKKHEIVLDRVLKQLVRTIIRLGIVAGNPLDASSEIVVDFDDSIIEDKQAERKQDMQDVSIGAMPMWEYRMKWYNEDEATAKSRVNTPAEVIE